MRFPLLITASLCATASFLTLACTPTPPPTTSTLAPGATASRTLDLDAGTFVLGEVHQTTVDVTATVKDPDGETLREVDANTAGIEIFQFETEAAGAYQVEIAANDDGEGTYALHIVRSEPVATDPVARLDQLMSRWDGPDRPGAIAAVVHQDDVIAVRTYGMANLSHDVPWDRATISNIGSVTKQFTAMGLLVLESTSDFSLDDDIRDHLPELTDFGEPITPRELLNHTSGYREIYNLMRIGGFGGEDTFSREHAITVVQRQDALQNRPHTEWNYNNTGFILLSLLVERITGQSFADYMRDNVFQPLGMNDTRVKMVQGELIPGSAQGYGPTEAGPYRTTRDLPASAGAGGVYTTVDDLHRWLRNFNDPSVGGPDAIEAMATSAVLESGDETGYGLGLAVGELGGRTLFSHTGGDVSHRAYLGYLPELEAGVILMSNNATFNLGLGSQVFRLFFDDELEPEEAEDTEDVAEDDPSDADDPMSDERKQAIAGDWVLTVQGLTIPMEVVVEDGQVYIDITGQDQSLARPTSDSTITIAAADATFTFRQGPDGNIDTGAATQAGIDMTMERAEGVGLSEDDLHAFAGRYLSEELETFMTVAVEDGQLIIRQLGQTPQPLRHVTGDNFSAEVFHLNEIAFQRAESGAVTGFTVSNGRTRGVWFAKM